MPEEKKIINRKRKPGRGYYKAGLLWKLLTRPMRQELSFQLDTNEIHHLNRAFQDYKQLEKRSRSRIEKELIRQTSYRFPLWPGIATALLTVFLVILLLLHIESMPSLSPQHRAELFLPLLLGCLGPFLLYFMPFFRVRQLFDFRTNAEGLFFTFGGFLGLLWTLAMIQMMEVQIGIPLAGLSFLILLLGALSAPLLEELAFRELFPALFGKPPYWVGHLISAILFSVSHLPSSLQMAVLYFLAALFLSLTRIQTGGLFYPVLIHSLVNGVMLLI